MQLKSLLDFTWLYSNIASNQVSDGLDAPRTAVKQVAIIGAGAAGSSTAYHLRKYADEAGLDLNVTVFERTGHIGGRTLTVDVFGDAAQPVELGASIFVDVNHILINATRDFELPVKAASRGSGSSDEAEDDDELLGIWDGSAFVYSQNSGSWDWWNLAKLFWRYGSAPYYVHRLVQDTVASFLRLYEAPYFPFRSLTERATELGLLEATGSTGQQFLEANKLAGAFARDIVQAGTRVNYAANLGQIHGLGTMVAMAPEGAKAVAGGNWQIFAEMVRRSGAVARLNTSVTSIRGDDDAGYLVSSASGKVQETARFDAVVLAAPLQFADLDIHASAAPDIPVDKVPYATLHVTLFASPLRLSPAFFGLAPGAAVPSSVLTTLGPNDDSSDADVGAGTAGFYSVTRVRTATNPATGRREFVYKVFSPAAVTAEFLSKLLGAEVPETFVSAAPSESKGDDEEDAAAALDPVSWIHPAVFNPYPQALPRVTFQDPVLRTDGNLYYTAGVESFISTMETSALMGMNVARLIMDEYAEKTGEAKVEAEEKEVVVVPEGDAAAEVVVVPEGDKVHEVKVADGEAAQLVVSEGDEGVLGGNHESEL
ncbi:Prenylcysteine oxidase [Xylariomycetidae sp. FL0641]|nr:Prenylcysteine oxidase [Xylariomycetidae sp. FL0641]